MSIRKISQHLRLFILMMISLALFAGCSGLPQNDSSDELPSDEVATEDVAPESGSGGGDDFAEFSDETQPAEQAPATTTENQNTENQTSDATDSLLEEVATDNQQNQEQPAQEVAQNQPDEFQEFENQAPEPQPTQEPVVTTEPVPETVVADPILAPETPQVESPPATKNLATIKSVQYKANDAGGTLVIEADRPIQFQTRQNPDTNQLIVEVPNASIPDRIRRPLNMKDIAGTIGSVDPYQLGDSTTARFVIQMRPNTTVPFVTAEGNTLLVISEKALANQAIQSLTGGGSTGPSAGEGGAPVTIVADDSKILTTKTLYEFLDKNNKFYGKKISIETVNMPVADALRFIADEAGINIVLDPDLNTGDSKVNLKMKDVPWDQAFVVILKTNNLGYLRIGDLLRVTTQTKITAEEEAAIKRYTENAARSPLKFKVFEINYIKASELLTKVEKFLTPGADGTGGKAFSDDRANQIIVQDREDNLPVISDIITQFDQQPPQVLIEGRIIEAADSFTRSLGVNWGASGADVSLGNGINLRPSLGIATGPSSGNGTLGINLGTLDVLGDLSATLALSELEGKIRILSSPRVVTLNNEKAKIAQGTKIPVVTVTANAGTTAIPSTTFVDVNLSMEVTPQITADSSVIMNIKVNRSLISAASAPGQTPAIDNREAETRVMVKNGQTSIIGGVYQNDTSNTTIGVPWLKDIPLLGALFRSKDTKVQRNELMIFITPRVVTVAKAPFLSTKPTTETVGQVEGGLSRAN